MDDAAKLMGQGLIDSDYVLRLETQNKALRASVKEGQRLLKAAVKQRDLAQANERRILEQHHLTRAILSDVKRQWLYRFFPAWLKAHFDRQAL